MSLRVDEHGHAGDAPLRLTVIGRYIALALATSWAIQIPAILALGLDNSATRALFVLVMWSPTFIAWIFMARIRRARAGVRWKLGRVRYLPVGIAVETLVAFGILATMAVAGLATSGWFTFAVDGVVVDGGPWILGDGAQSWPLYVLNVIVTATVYSVIGLVAATGEEFAWRGFLQGHLEDYFGAVRAILIVALVWWMWHLPGLVAGYNFPETPLLGAFVLFPLQMIGTSFFFGWLAIRSNSFWPAALAHAAVNSIQQGMVDNLQLVGPQLHVHLVRTGLLVSVGLVCWASLRARSTESQASR